MASAVWALRARRAGVGFGLSLALAANGLFVAEATGQTPVASQGEIARIEALHAETGQLLDAGEIQAAESVAREALAAADSAFGASGQRTAISILNLAEVLRSLARLEEAEELQRRVVSIYETFPEDEGARATGLNNLGETLSALNHLDESEQLHRRALAIRTKIFPEAHPSIAYSLTNLAGVLKQLNRLEESELLFRRALSVFEKSLPSDSLELASAINNLSVVLRSLGRLDEAEKLGRRSLSIRERALPPTHFAIATGLTNLADVLRGMSRLDEAEQLNRRALSIFEKALPTDHPSIANSMTNLAGVLRRLNRLDEAEGLHRKALAIKQRALPENHPDIAISLHNLAVVRGSGQGDFREAMELQDKAMRVYAAPENRATIATRRLRFSAFLRVAFAGGLWERDGQDAIDAIRTARRAAFVDLQWEREGGTGGAISAATARARADEGVAALARERDAVLQAIKGVDTAFLATASSTEIAPEDRKAVLDRLRAESALSRERITAIDEEIAQRFPAYAELSESIPATVEELQSVLREDEVLLSVTPDKANGFFYAFVRDGGIFIQIPDAAEASAMAGQLRCSAAGRLDRGCVGEAQSQGLSPIEARGATSLRAAEIEGDFDLALAHDLYNRLFPAEARDVLKGKKLIIAPAPELMGLPWHLLVTEPPPADWNAPGTDRARAYREAKWLFQNHPSITVLPTVASLRALRSTAPARNPADRAYLGVGDPVIGRSEAERDAPPMKCGPGAGAQVASADADAVVARSAGSEPAALFGGERDADGFALADPEKVRSQPRLADTRCELTSVAESLSAAGRADLALGPEASEARIRDLDKSGELARYRVLHFATHGLLGGELGIGEPGLVLTPPDRASARDDGILTASEISTLTLAADWVVLSACNTAAGSGDNAEALSGLARSFFYAGAKSLLVSSWPVYSPAAVDLTTRAFDAMKDDPSIGRAEALTNAMRGVLKDSRSEFTAHPAYWASFTLVGEGAQ